MSGRKRTRSSVAQEAALEASTSTSGAGPTGIDMDGPFKPSKTPRLDSDAPIHIPRDDDEDDLEEILELIKASEESEAMAMSMQEEWNKDIPSSSHAHSPEVIMVDSDSEEVEEIQMKPVEKVNGKNKGKGKAVGITNGTTSARRSTNGVQPVVTVRLGEEPPDYRLIALRDLFSGDKQCPDCNTKLQSPRGNVTFSETIPPPTLTQILHIFCDTCGVNHCRGCLASLPSCPETCKGPSKNAECTASTCCLNIRTIALFETLACFDRLYIGEKAKAEERIKEAQKARRSGKGKNKSVGPGGTGYGADDVDYDDLGDYFDEWSEESLMDYEMISSFMPTNGSRGRGRGRGAASSTSRGGRGRGATIHFLSRGGGRSRATRPPPEPSPHLADAAHLDLLLVRALKTITYYLPHPSSPSAATYDLIPHPSILPLLSLSQLPELLASLLRNDSVTEWVARSEVYYAMLELLRRLADCEVTFPLLIDRQWEKKDSPGIEAWMWGELDVVWETTMTNKETFYSRSLPLYSHFKKLTKQCEAFMAGASKLMEGGADGAEPDEEMEKTVSLCGDIIATKDSIERAMKVIGKSVDSFEVEDEVPAAASSEDVVIVEDEDEARRKSGPMTRSRTKGKGKAPPPPEESELKPIAVDERLYTRECERLAFQHISLGEEDKGGGFVYRTFNYANKLKETEGKTRIPKDRLHLVKELAVMATSLPPGVWVRVDEVRNDAIKIMIAGPVGTPYEGGLFEFDCWMPIEYPNVPPLMHLRTTGGGTVRFNPNLYNNGKVCLSLLGTWHGRPEEQWSRKSTLLQVLVSIQSMILVDLPYFNEPGYGRAKPDLPQSIKYNEGIRLGTVRWGMVEWLKDEHLHGIWGDVIASHFNTRGDSIRRTIEIWSKTQPSIRAYAPSSHHHHLHGDHPIFFGGPPPPDLAWTTYSEDLMDSDEEDDLWFMGDGSPFSDFPPLPSEKGLKDIKEKLTSTMNKTAKTLNYLKSGVKDVKSTPASPSGFSASANAKPGPYPHPHHHVPFAQLKKVAKSAIKSLDSSKSSSAMYYHYAPPHFAPSTSTPSQAKPSKTAEHHVDMDWLGEPTSYHPSKPITPYHPVHPPLPPPAPTSTLPPIPPITPDSPPPMYYVSNPSHPMASMMPYKVVGNAAGAFVASNTAAVPPVIGFGSGPPSDVASAGSSASNGNGISGSGEAPPSDHLSVISSMIKDQISKSYTVGYTVFDNKDGEKTEKTEKDKDKLPPKSTGVSTAGPPHHHHHFGPTKFFYGLTSAPGGSGGASASGSKAKGGESTGKDAKKMDLLEEFDKGMERMRKWMEDKKAKESLGADGMVVDRS